MTILITVLAGIIIFVAGRSIEKFFIDPWKRQREVIGEVFETLIYHANVYTKPVYIANRVINDERTKKQEETYKAVRKASAQLMASTYSIFFYDLFAIVFRMPGKKDIFKAARALSDLSINLYSKETNDFETAIMNKNRRGEIVKALGLSRFQKSFLSDKQGAKVTSEKEN
jgi:hypothetical protein